MKVLGIEIGYSLIRICVTDFKSKNPKIYKAVSMVTPGNVVDDGMLTVTDELVDKLKAVLRNNHIRVKNVVFSISSTKIAGREILIPDLKENKIADLVETNAPDYFPMDISQYRITYSIQDTITDENGTKKIKLNILATPNQMIDRYKELAAKCGLQAIAVDYSGNSIFQMVKNQLTEGVIMLIKADERMAYLMILKEGKILLQRTVSYGVDEALEIFGESHNGLYSYMDMLNSFHKEDYILGSLEAEAPLEEGELKTNITESLGYLVKGIGRVLDFYNSKNQQDAVKQIYVTGIGGGFKNFNALLEHELGISTARLEAGQGSAAAKAFENEEGGFGLYLSCIGAEIAPLWSVASDNKKKRTMPEKNAGTDLTRISIIVLSLGMFAALVITAYSIGMQVMLVKHQDELNEQIDTYKSAENIYNRYNYTNMLYTDALNIENISGNRNDMLKAFIEEMEMRLSSDITVLSLTAEPESITLNINVGSKAAAAQIVAELRKFDSISQVETIGLTDTINETGYHDINFTVNCVYDGGSQKGEAEEE